MLSKNELKLKINLNSTNSNEKTLSKSVSSKPKTFLLQKIDESSPFVKEVKQSFNDPANYLKILPHMIVGKICKGPRVDEDLKLIPHSVVGSVQIFEDLQNMRKNTTYKYSARTMATHPIFSQITKKISKPNFESVDKLKLDRMYNDFEKTQKQNEENVNDFMINLPNKVKNLLKIQENSLKISIQEENKNAKLSKFISSKINRNEENLLFNKTNVTRIKKEYNDHLDNKIPLNGRYGNNGWLVSLRRPENFSGSRTSYVNLGSNMNPQWANIRENIPKKIETIRKPFMNYKKDLKKYLDNKHLVKSTEDNEDIKRGMNEITNLIVIYLLI